MALSFHFKFQRTITVITFIFIAIRLYIRCWVRWRLPSLSDLFVLAAWGMYFTSVIVDGAIAPHLDLENNVEDLIWYLKWVYYWFFQYFTIYYAIKASLLLFYNEWIPRSLNRLWIANRVVMVICGVCFLYTACVNLFRCHPISVNWDPNTKCQSARKWWVFVSTSVLHLFTDLLIYILPIFVLYYMSGVSNTKKFGAAFMFMLGIISITFSALRFSLAVWTKYHPDRVVNPGVTYVSQNLDESAGIFVVCCPQIKLFLVRCYKFWKTVYYKLTDKRLTKEMELSSLKNSGGRADKGVEAGSLSSRIGITTFASSPGRADGSGFDFCSIKSPVVALSPGMQSDENPPARTTDVERGNVRASEQELMERIQAFNFGR